LESLGRANVTLNEYSRAATDQLKSYGSLHNITKSNTVLAGNPAQKLVYIMKQSSSESILPNYILQLFTIKDGKAYIITYNSAWLFDRAAVSSMIKSFRLSAPAGVK
jgi:hypothetical protein